MEMRSYIDDYTEVGNMPMQKDVVEDIRERIALQLNKCGNVNI